MASEEGESSMPAMARPSLPLNMINDIPAVMFKWQVDPKTGESTFLYLSEYCQDLMGISPQEALQDASFVLNLIVEGDVAGFSDALIQSMQDLSLFQIQVRLRRPTDGNVVSVQFQGRPQRQPVEGRDEPVTVWDGVILEVAPSAAIALKGSRDAPHHESDAATTLVRAERGLTEWLHHEIKNPLSVTMEALQTLQELTVPEQLGKHHEPTSSEDQAAEDDDGYSAAECHQVMTDSITYVVDLLNNMMDLDQCAQGQMPVVNAPCHVQTDILLPTYRMMRRLRPKNPVKLRLAPTLKIAETATGSGHSSLSFIDLDEPSEQAEGGASGSGSGSALDDVVAYVDKLRLRQVLTNLIANAFHFTTEGFVELDLQVQEPSSDASPDAVPMLSFHVRDSGCGVNPRDIDTLFSRWEQLGTSRNGTGIGLCLCQALLKAMGGNIRLNTAYHSGVEGHPGAEFIVEMPIHTEPDTPPTSNAGARKMSARAEPTTPPSSSLTSAILASQPSLMASNPPVRRSKPSLATASPASAEPASHDYSLLGMSQSLQHLSSDSIHSRRSSYSTTLSSSISSFATATTAVTMSTASTMGGSNLSSATSPIQKKSYFRGAYRFLIVDDEKMGRKFLKRRFSRLFPESNITEVASGEAALAEAAKEQYDIITMDHFMAINEMNGDETIRKLRSQLHSDALIMGISGNDKQLEHLHAGADLFFLKPLPSDTTLIESLQHKLAPPAGWRVLILSQDESISAMLTERLQRVASPHYTTQECATKRWTIVSRSNYVVDPESFDMVVLVESDSKSAAINQEMRTRLRIGQKENLVIVECFSSEAKEATYIAADGTTRAAAEAKPCGPIWNLSSLPSIEVMRQSLCQALLATRNTPDRAKNASGNYVPVNATRLPPKRQNSGVAKSA